MLSNRYLTLANLVCASCVLHLNIINLFLQHVHPAPPGQDIYDNFLVFDAPLLLCAFYSVLFLILYSFAHKYKWQIGVAFFFEIIHFGMSTWNASQFLCYPRIPGLPRMCTDVQRGVVAICNILFLAGGLVSQTVSLYRQYFTSSDNDEELLIINNSN